MSWRESLRSYVRTYYDVQKLRVACANRLVQAFLAENPEAKIGKKGRGISDRLIKSREFELFVQRLEGSNPIAKLYRRLLDYEDAVMKAVEDMVSEHVMWPWLSSVKGVGSLHAAVILSEVDIEKADTISSLWKFAGYCPGPRPRRGEKRWYNAFLKRTLYLVGQRFIILKTQPYEEVYRSAKARYSARQDLKDAPKIRIHLMSMRKMIQVFLSHLWLLWRWKLGLSIRPPYPLEYLAHADFIPVPNEDADPDVRKVNDEVRKLIAEAKKRAGR